MNAPIEMTVEECLKLLDGGVVGRVAWASPVGPRIHPVNYAMHDRAIVFRVAPYSELGTSGLNGDLAFEVDHLDYESHLGWSVVAIGRATLVEDPEEIDDIRRTWDPRPWASGTRNLYVKLPWRTLTGRRLGAGWSEDTLMPVRRVL